MSPFSRVIGRSTVAWLCSVEFLQFRVKIRFQRISGARQARRGKFFGFTRDAEALMSLGKRGERKRERRVGVGKNV